MSDGVVLGRDAGAQGVTLAAVAAGGALGSLGRWGVGLVASGAVWSTLLVNLTGAFAMGVLVVWLARGVPHPLARPFLSVGLLGGWTTYSSFALDAHGLVADGLGGFLGYLLATLVPGIGAAALGLVVGDRAWGGDAASDEVVAEEEL